MNLLSFMILITAILAVVVAPLCMRRLNRRPRGVACNIAEGTHDCALSKLTDAAITTRHLLYKFGSDAGHIAVMAATSDVPVGTVPDEASAAEEDVSVLLLGRGPTKKMIASEAIAVADEVFTTATGKVQNRPAGAGTYWYVGRALTAAAADNDPIEVNDCVPVRVVIP